MSKKVVIDRATWNSGERYSDAALVATMRDSNTERCYCCLGFLGLACGVQEYDMVDLCLPYNLRSNPSWPDGLFDQGSATLGAQDTHLYARIDGDRWDEILAAINDADEIDDALREEWIKAGFKIRFDMDVEFVGAYGERLYNVSTEDEDEDYDYDAP